MNLNPNIIMAGQQPDVVNALARSSQAAGLTNRVRRDNRLNQLYQEQGAGLLSGDQNALNALAAQDPRQALQFQQVHQQNERQARQDALSGQEFAFRIQKWAQQASDAEAAKEAEEYKTLVHMAATAETPEQWDQIVTQYGGDDGQELIGQFGNRDALLGKYMTAAQIIEQSKPQKPLSPVGKLKQDLRDGIITIEEFNAATQKSGIRVESDGKGGFTFTQGVGAVDRSVSGDSVGDVYNPGEVNQTLALIDEIMNDPALSRVTGPIEGGGSNDVGQLNAAQRLYYGGEGLSVIQKINQLQSRAWLAARDMLKGGGSITDFESRKAEAAVARLERAQGDAEFVAALTDLQDAIQSGMAKLEASRKGAPTESSEPTLEFQNDEQRAIFEKYSQ